MKTRILVGIALCFGSLLFAQSADEIAISKTLNNYINGGSFSNPEQIKSAFTEDATLYLTKRDGSSMTFTPQSYTDIFKTRPQGEFTGRIGNILSIEVINDVASAKVEIVTPKNNSYYIDLFLLKKTNNAWKIVSKTATKKEQNCNGRILFIVSNAKFYGETNLKTGTSFSEIVDAYDTFVTNDYYVDFVSPKGGDIAIAYYNEADSLQKEYYSNKTFMNRLKYTKSPKEINASSYKAVYYVGGGSAMFEVPENKEIQAISMAVYEKENGVISAVCHGTAGIVNLQTKDGEYLVKGKKISGYPEAYENKEKPYFKTFPFLIQETIEKRGGDFNYEKRRAVYYEADGRLITGQSNLASKVVALKVIETIK